MVVLDNYKAIMAVLLNFEAGSLYNSINKTFQRFWFEHDIILVWTPPSRRPASPCGKGTVCFHIIRTSQVMYRISSVCVHLLYSRIYTHVCMDIWIYYSVHAISSSCCNYLLMPCTFICIWATWRWYCCVQYQVSYSMYCCTVCTNQMTRSEKNLLYNYSITTV